VLLKRRTK